ncbi:MAG: hypothetical protein F8N37_11970 [Telmatospirillum sp.]|nr:hypothetical protein [Telmatospirillum sp.]
MRNLFLCALALILLSGCSSTIAELAKDPATVSVHQEVVAPGWTVKTDYVRANSVGATGAAGSNGTSAGTRTDTPAPVPTPAPQ